jgi:hypothetical protein
MCCALCTRDVGWCGPMNHAIYVLMVHTSGAIFVWLGDIFLCVWWSGDILVKLYLIAWMKKTDKKEKILGLCVYTWQRALVATICRPGNMLVGQMVILRAPDRRPSPIHTAEVGTWQHAAPTSTGPRGWSSGLCWEHCIHRYTTKALCGSWHTANVGHTCCAPNLLATLFYWVRI